MMMTRNFRTGVAAALCWALLLLLQANAESVNESARSIPVAHEVDVAVVGGSTGAVAAAIAAAAAGASVFLATPHPYLGDDMTATLRLWLEKDETPEHPLAVAMFDDPERGPPRETSYLKQFDFTYTASRPSASLHSDTDPPSLLNDGRWGSASRQSVQYDGNVSIIATLEKARELGTAQIVVYSRDLTNESGSGFNVAGVTAYVSDDQETWVETAAVEGQPDAGDGAYIMTVPINAAARYVRLDMEKPAEHKRILLGEIMLFGSEVAGDESLPARPMHIKKALDDALLDAGVEFLYSSVAVDMLRDAEANPAGIVIANRSGRQAVLAKTIIDATSRAQFTRAAGGEFREYPAGTHTFRYTVVGGEVVEKEGLRTRVIGPPYTRFCDCRFLGFYCPVCSGRKEPPTRMGDYKTIEYTLELDMPGGGYPAFAAAEQEVRTLTYHPGQQDTADQLFQIPPDPVHALEPAVGPWEGAEAVNLNSLRPRGLPWVYVLGGCADVPREHAKKLMRPLALMDLGRRVGAAAAAEAAARGALESVKLPGQETLSPAATGDVREPLDWHRPTNSSDLSVVEQEARAVPVLGEYDVVVIGGGTSGAPAGIAAARQGARVLVVEYLHMLGGTGTAGHIVRYYHGNRVGFSAEVLGGASRWELEQRAEWWRSKLIEAGGEVWFGALGVGAFVEDDTVRGAVVVTPWQRGVVLADVVIDATGRSAVAAAAGAEIEYTDASTVAVQGTGLSVLRPGVSYANSDFTITDDTDVVDASQVFVYAKHKYPRAYDQGKLITTRERPRIVGDARITVRDQLMGRSYPDTVVRAQSDFDSHGYTIDPYFFVEHPGRARIRADIPYRAMLPQGLEGILVVGLGISAQRDALPAIRMQPDIQNGGYAAGVAASMAADSGLGLREIDVRALQRRLVAVGNLPKGVLEHEDSYPLPPEKIAAAVAALPRANDFRSAASVLAHPEQALPLLKDAYAGAEGAAKLSYAKVLAIIGDSAGLDTLIGQVQAAVQWDDGWDYQGAAQYDAAHSELDELIIALGKTAKPEAVPTILDKVELLTADHAFSHHRAVGLALELIADPAAAEPLARLLGKPDMSGKHHPDIAAAIEREVNQPGGMNAVTTRRESLRELLLARALYRCGDHDGIGRQILENYTTDLRGHLARHAKAVLADE